MDDGRLGEQIAQFLAAVPVFLDDLDPYAGVDQLLREIERDLAAAYDHAVPDSAALKADPCHKISGIFLGRNDTDDIPGL